MIELIEFGKDYGAFTAVDRLSLKTIVESCLVLEDGIASAKDNRKDFEAAYVA